MIDYWPFCVAANRTADYALIAAPDFLISAGELDFFRCRDFRLTEAMRAGEIRPIAFSRVIGAFVCAHHAAPTVIDGEAQHDQAGRALYHAIGFIGDAPDVDDETAGDIYRHCLRPMSDVLALFMVSGDPIVRPVLTKRIAYGAPAMRETL